MATPPARVSEVAADESAAGGPIALVVTFLELLAAGELDRATDLLHRDVLYTNVSLPSIRGRERVRRLATATVGRDAANFEVYVHSCAADGSVVLTDRTDVLTYGRLRVQFWVYGRFEIRDERIIVWRDSFDWLNISAATARGLLAVLIPALRAKPPRR